MSLFHSFDTAAVNPALNQPTRPHPLHPANLLALYIAGKKAGQMVLPNTGGGPTVRNFLGGVPRGIPPEMQGNIPVAFPVAWPMV